MGTPTRRNCPTITPTMRLSTPSVRRFHMGVTPSPATLKLTSLPSTSPANSGTVTRRKVSSSPPGGSCPPMHLSMRSSSACNSPSLSLKSLPSTFPPPSLPTTWVPGAAKRLCTALRVTPSPNCGGVVVVAPFPSFPVSVVGAAAAGVTAAAAAAAPPLDPPRGTTYTTPRSSPPPPQAPSQ